MMTGQDFPFSRPSVNSPISYLSYSDSFAVAENKNVGIQVVFPVVWANENTDAITKYIYVLNEITQLGHANDYPAVFGNRFMRTPEVKRKRNNNKTKIK